MRRALLVVGLLCWGLASATAQNQKAPRSFTSAAFGFLDANRVRCSLTNVGGLCTDVSSIVGGGVWPASTATGYMFGSGLQFAALISDTAGGGRPAFAWAGDTVGVLFFDVNGTQETGEALTEVFDSRDTLDLGSWPTAALVRDASLFDFLHVGQKAVSPQDIWMRYWDGNPRLLSGRTHPMGIVVDQRAMAFPYPGPNADIVYFVFTIYNVTARTASAYANPTIPAEVQPEIAALGARFQDSSEARLAVAIPDAGYTLDSVYVGLQVDPDIGAARDDYATASLPFGLGMAYTGLFSEPGWNFPAEIFGAPPFAAAPGFVGALFPTRPAPITTFTTFGGGGSMDPPQNIPQLWRYLSFNFSPSAGDAPCNTTGGKARIVCFVTQTSTDVRAMLSFGPFSLAPGEAKAIVLSYVFAAPLDTINAYADSIMRPRWAFTGDSIALDSTKVLPPERAAGWLTQNDANGNGIIEASEVTTARRSLLHKAQAAQAFVDRKFPVPTGPAAPEFFLVPGDNEVTVVWRPSTTESAGDPYYAVASDSTSPLLYDPNYRRFDVEGYRIYRGRDPRALELIAQIDHDSTTFVDYLAAVAYPGRCAPEFAITVDCPVAFGPAPDRSVFHRMTIAGHVVQLPEGSRIKSTTGAVTPAQADTFPARGYPLLLNTGVTYTFTDSTVRNSFRYYYAVTAFDFNSIRSGPSSFESSYSIRAVTPRVPSGQETAGAMGPARLLGADGTPLDSLALPGITAATGVFSGPMPPTDGLAITLDAFLPQLLADGAVTLVIDSIIPGAAVPIGVPGGLTATYYMRAQGPGKADSFVVALPMDGFDREEAASVRFDALALTDSQARRFTGDSTFGLTGTASLRVPGAFRLALWGRADANGFPPFSSHNGPRWWAGAPNENTVAPNELVCTPAASTCVQADLTRNAGRLPGVDTLFHLQAYSTVPNTPMRELDGIGATVYRAADLRVYWGTGGGGLIDSVVDLTHHVRVPYSPKIRASWGLLTDSSFALAGTDQSTTGDGNNSLLTWADALCVDPAPAYLGACGAAAQRPATLQNHARLSPVSARSSTYAGTASLPQTGQGFIFYINGHFFLMQLAALPPAGTQWNVRFYAGTVTGTAAQANYAFIPAIRPPAVPGLRAQIAFTGSRLAVNVTTDSLLARVHTVPDPFYVQSGYELGVDTLALKFVNLPARAIVRIYSTSGILVAMLLHNDPTGGGELTWDLRSRTGRRVASGVYFYHVETPDGRRKLGRFVVVTGPHPRR